MKKLVKLSSLVLAFTFAMVALAACGGDDSEPAALGMGHVDVYTYADDTVSAKLTDTAVGGNKVSMENGRLRVDVAADVNDVEFDLAPFFAKNTKYKGKNFYFTRSDIGVDGGTDLLIKGNAWVETTAGTSSTRLYKKLGSENDATAQEVTKAQISAMENGAVRMYILNKNIEKERCLVYIDSTTASNLASGETAVDFTFYGHNGEEATLKVSVHKATA